MKIDKTSRAVASRLQDSIDYASTFTTVEMAYFIYDILNTWAGYKPSRAEYERLFAVLTTVRQEFSGGSGVDG